MTEPLGDVDELDEDLDVFEQSPEEASQSVSTLRDLPQATLLSVEDADAFLRWRPASIVAIIGERNGGKTTLISEIYAQFLKGKFADYMFSHSLSLMGFEKKIFQSRSESGLEVPDTQRTSAQEGLSFFHLQIADLLTNSSKHDLLISERAGETYKDIRDKPELASSLLEITKSEIIVLIIDGERVCDARERAEVFASIRNIARALVQSEYIQEKSRIQLVTTKFDLLQGDNSPKALEALVNFEETIRKIFDNKHLISTHRVAARDPKRLMDPAHGVAELLRSWLQPKVVAVGCSLKLPTLVSEFDKLALRRTSY
ncbi:TRAFAC clade GTPase domain-containing protein [Pseudomonas monteilii]|uniref:TRAFAC clade GTPase domain-containing protein n=1 Tax=Pseudomonas monteilii TaxID=76759 RepID=UPI003906C8D7